MRTHNDFPQGMPGKLMGLAPETTILSINPTNPARPNILLNTEDFKLPQASILSTILNG